MMGAMEAGLRLVRFVIWSTLFVTQGHAQASDPLQTLVARLQQAPQDDALRKEVIRHALEMKPEPTIPAQALQHERKGAALFGEAKNQEHYVAAAREYERAPWLAPWVARLYFGLGEIYEKIGDAAVGDHPPGAQPRQSCSREAYNKERRLFDGYDQARKNFDLYLLARPNTSERDQAMIKHKSARQQFSLVRWRHQWETACCQGCGGKQSTIR